MKKIHVIIILAIAAIVGVVLCAYFYNEQTNREEARRKELALHYKSRIEDCQLDINLFKITLKSSQEMLNIKRESSFSTPSEIRDEEGKVRDAKNKIAEKEKEIRQYEDKIRELGFRISH